MYLSCSAPNAVILLDEFPNGSTVNQLRFVNTSCGTCNSVLFIIGDCNFHARQNSPLHSHNNFIQLKLRNCLDVSVFSFLMCLSTTLGCVGPNGTVPREACGPWMINSTKNHHPSNIGWNASQKLWKHISTCIALERFYCRNMFVSDGVPINSSTTPLYCNLHFQFTNISQAFIKL